MSVPCSAPCSDQKPLEGAALRRASGRAGRLPRPLAGLLSGPAVPPPSRCAALLVRSFYPNPVRAPDVPRADARVAGLPPTGLRKGPPCSECSSSDAADASLVGCLARISRMDIVHLMEAGAEPLAARAGRSHAEAERATALGRSEGQCGRPPDLESCRPRLRRCLRRHTFLLAAPLAGRLVLPVLHHPSSQPGVLGRDSAHGALSTETHFPRFRGRSLRRQPPSCRDLTTGATERVSGLR